MGDAKHMGIYGDALDDAECLIEHHICSPCALRRGSILHLVYVAGNFAAEIGHDHLCAGDAVFCLGTVKPNWSDDPCDVFGVGLRHGLWRSVFRKQLGRYLIHTCIGCLGGERNGNGEREWRGVVKRAGCLSVMTVHAFGNG